MKGKALLEENAPGTDDTDLFFFNLPCLADQQCGGRRPWTAGSLLHSTCSGLSFLLDPRRLIIVILLCSGLSFLLDPRRFIIVILLFGRHHVTAAN
jgi:hypothetical protein